MANRNHSFPSDFLWGASTSGFQVEGAFDLDGKVPATTDVRIVPDGIADNKIAADHYHHLEEDIVLMKELGLGIYRFSFQWSRVMKNETEKNEAGIAFYSKIIDLCLENGLVPFPTLYHFEMPQMFVDNFQGWLSRKCIDAYCNYARVCFEAFGDRVHLWGTINEQLIVTAAGDLNGNHEPDPQKQLKNMYQMSYNMSVAEKKVIQMAHELMPECQIGPVCSIQVVYPETPDPADIKASRDAADFLQNMFLDMSVFGRYPKSVMHYLKRKDLMPDMPEEDQKLLKEVKPDLIGINYYCSTCIRALRDSDDNSKLPPFYRSELYTLGNNPYLPKTEWMEFGIDPQGLYIGIRDIYERYGLPMIVTENGMAFSESSEGEMIVDDYRVDYLSRHIDQVEKLIEEGYPVLGYCPWSFLDVVSSHQGYAKRYGLVYVNRTDTDLKDCRRIPKKSYYWYKGFIAQSKNKEGE